MAIELNFPELENHPELKEALENFYIKKNNYILDDNKNVIPATIEEWGIFLNGDKKKRIVKQEIVDGFFVSTVFIGIDHNFLSPKPHIFETMIFNHKDREEYCDRYSTWQEAEEGHEKAVQWVKDGCKDEN